MERIIKELQAAGYTVRADEDFPGQWYVDGNGIAGTICEEFDPDAWWSGCLVVDNARCYDAMHRCPMVVKAPFTVAEILPQLQHLASDEGFEIARNRLIQYSPDNPWRYDRQFGDTAV